jgi:hypothetical protein
VIVFALVVIAIFLVFNFEKEKSDFSIISNFKNKTAA